MFTNFKKLYSFNNKGGFTLLELLVVIGIITIIAAAVFVSLDSAREKTRRSSNLATLASAMPEVVVCGDDGGFGYTDSSSLAGKFVCQGASTGNSQFGSHTILWPSTTAGWVYGIPTGSLASSNYQYTATKSGQATITCDYSLNRCQ